MREMKDGWIYTEVMTSFKTKEMFMFETGNVNQGLAFKV